MADVGTGAQGRGVKGIGADGERARVVEFWRAVEIFSPQVIPASNARRNIYEITGGGPLPWDSGHPLRRVELKKDQVWRHTVYAGIFDVRRMADLLEDEFGADAESFDGLAAGSERAAGADGDRRGTAILRQRRVC